MFEYTFTSDLLIGREYFILRDLTYQPKSAGDYISMPLRGVLVAIETRLVVPERTGVENVPHLDWYVFRLPTGRFVQVRDTQIYTTAERAIDAALGYNTTAIHSETQGEVIGLRDTKTD